MTISGVLDPSGQDLVLTREVPAPVAVLWAHLTRSDLLATWYGTYTGDPSSGTVEVTMTAEPGEASTSPYTIHACEPERLLSVSAAAGAETWRLSVSLTGAAADATTVVLRHHDLPVAVLGDIGPGWEWYLDRLSGAVTGGELPGMDVWETRYMSLSPEYAALAP